jgi:hypothetical protein
LLRRLSISDITELCYGESAGSADKTLHPYLSLPREVARPGLPGPCEKNQKELIYPYVAKRQEEPTSKYLAKRHADPINQCLAKTHEKPKNSTLLTAQRADIPHKGN